MSLFKRTVWVLALVLIAAVLVGNAFVSYRNTAALAQSMAASAHSRDALNAIDDVLQAVTDAETGQRGYLLTSNETYLDPYVAARASLDARVAELQRLVTSDPAQRARFESLDGLIGQKLSELQHSLDLARSGQGEEALSRVTTNVGANLMRDIRATAGQMRAAEYAQQLSRDRRAAELYSRTQYTRILGMVIGLGLVLVAGLLLRRDLKARERAAREIFLQREWFSTTLGSIGDAVIVTDPHGRVQLINPVAAELTGWSVEEAKGRDLLEVFDIVNEGTRERADDPVSRALAEGRVVGLANHTVLRSRTGREYVIEDSAAPTHDAAGNLQGAVLVFHDATERRRADLALSAAAAQLEERAQAAQQGERTLNTILDNAQIGICMTGPAPDFRIVVLSRRMRDWIGAAENMPALAVYRKLLPDGREPPPDLIPLHRVMRQGQFVRDEPWLIERPGAQPLTVIVNVAPVRDEAGNIVGAIHSWMDLTERQRLDHDLRVSQSRLHVLIESNVIGLILSFDSEGKVSQANRAFYEMLGFAPGGDERLDLVAQTPVEYRAADQRAFAELRAVGFCAPYEKEFIARSDGRRVSVVVGYAKVAETADEFVGFALDISARRALEGKLRVQADELRAAARRKDEFLAMLAHELRNPLSPLRNAIHLLDERHGEGTAPVADMLPMMRRQIDHLVRLVDDLLDAARISQGKIAIDKAVIELAPCLEAAVESIQPLIDARGQHLEVDLGGRPLFVSGDSARVVQMVSNILHNAAKYTSRDGHVRLTLARDGDDALIAVRDDGQGIAPELLPRIFDTFVQDDQSLARSAGGLGVGLALVRRLSELHGGRVSAASAGAGQGSLFELRLPLVEAPLAPAQSAGRKPASSGASRMLRVLVVDDNADLAASTVALLGLWGHEVRALHNGREVLDTALSFRPDVILLDIGLPGMDGFEVARQLRGVAALEPTRLIAMTGYGQERDRLRSAQVGFDAHLVKPVQPAVLKALLDTHG